MFKHGEVTEKILKAFYKVYNVLGHGFLESVYQNSMVVELRKMGVDVEPQAPINVYYEGVQVGEYFADLFVNRCVIVELKVAEALCDEHHAQLLNYLKATDVEVGLLLNFGKKPETKRKVYDNRQKAIDRNDDPF
jgi:GxxExxY protein